MSTRPKITALERARLEQAARAQGRHDLAWHQCLAEVRASERRWREDKLVCDAEARLDPEELNDGG